MISEKQKFIYLIEAVAIIATHSLSMNAVTSTSVCKQLKLPSRYLEQELQNLVRLGILKSVRGPKGGYVLAKERRNITLLDLKLAMEEGASPRPLSAAAEVVVNKLESINLELQKITLYDILKDTEEFINAQISSSGNFVI